MMTSEKKNAVTAELKRKLNITWEQEDTEAKLESLVDSAEEYLNHLLGAEIDYSAPGMEKMLFLNYCMYEWNDCQDEFEDAYIKEINRVRAIYEVKDYENQEKEISEPE